MYNIITLIKIILISFLLDKDPGAMSYHRILKQYRDEMIYKLL